MNPGIGNTNLARINHILMNLGIFSARTTRIDLNAKDILFSMLNSSAVRPNKIINGINLIVPPNF
jgi:hypothetical protein